MFRVRDLRFGYRGHPIFNGVTFDLPEGSICGVLGVNGVGKSTLLKCLNRILEPEEGTVSLCGKEIGTLTRREIARHMAYVPQSTRATQLTVFEAVLLGRKPYIKWAPTRQDMEKVSGLLETMNLGPLAMRPIHQLSGGELQKVTIARALAQEPSLLLMDEPTSSLDLKNQIEVMTLVSETVTSQKLSAVVTMHDLNQAFRYADYFLMLKAGGVHAFAPKHGVTAQMIGEIYGVEVVLEEVQGHIVVVPKGTASPMERRKALKIV